MQLQKMNNCPYCNSEEIEEKVTYTTRNNGNRILFKCNKCKKEFSETKGTFIEGLVSPISFIAEVLTARSEGLGFNATCRTFEIGRDTLLNWEKKFAKLRYILFLYSLSHTLL